MRNNVYCYTRKEKNISSDFERLRKRKHARAMEKFLRRSYPRRRNVRRTMRLHFMAKRELISHCCIACIGTLYIRKSWRQKISILRIKISIPRNKKFMLKCAARTFRLLSYRQRARLSRLLPSTFIVHIRDALQYRTQLCCTLHTSSFLQNPVVAEIMPVAYRGDRE